jgi:hypothetical protein
MVEADVEALDLTDALIKESDSQRKATPEPDPKS